MIAYQKEKIENAICFFAAEHKKATNQFLYQTYLYKYLALLEFDSIKNIGRPVLGLQYKAMEKGPVPIEIYNKRNSYKTDCFEFKQIEQGIVIIPKGKPDLGYFSPYEIERMRRLIEIYASRFVKSKEMSESSHQEIRAWNKAWRKEKNSIIDYDLEFEDNIREKKPSDLTPAEESYLIYKSIEEAAN
jgi:uncharacterized phage-associated protein